MMNLRNREAQRTLFKKSLSVNAYSTDLMGLAYRGDGSLTALIWLDQFRVVAMEMQR